MSGRSVAVWRKGAALPVYVPEREARIEWLVSFFAGPNHTHGLNEQELREHFEATTCICGRTYPCGLLGCHFNGPLTFNETD